MSPPDAAAIQRIVTPRLVLRGWEADDTPLLKEAIDQSLEALQQWMPWAIGHPQPLDATLAHLVESQARFRTGDEWVYGIFDAAEARVLGGCGLHPRCGPGALEIGYWIRTDATGAGLAREVAAALTHLAFTQHGVERVEIHCDPRNTRSATIPRALGYRHVTTKEADGLTPTGLPRDTMIWVRTRDAGDVGWTR